jgi:Amt family ammonium transporter
MAFVGLGLLWVGWFGFNGGSALGVGSRAVYAIAATHFSACAGALVWVGIEWVHRGRPSVLGLISGAVAGLGTITPASGYVLPWQGALIGAIAGFVCFWASTWLKSKLRYDDSLDVFGVHGVAGTLGAILTGLFATRATGACGDGKLLGLLEGGPLLKAQLVAVAAGWTLAVVGTFVLLKVLDAVMGLRVARPAEIEGLDLSQHGEEGYILV